MKLQVAKRAAEKKCEIKAIRRQGDVPAVVYIRGKAGETISVNGAELNSLLRQVLPGRLSTTVFELAEKGAKTRRAILKDISYDPVSYQVIHLDFEELIDDAPINVKVPIEILGLVDCVGVKLGGVLRQVIRSLRVRCLPKDLPSHFPVDIRSMGINDVKRLADLNIPQTVRPLVDLHEVAVVIGKR